MSFILTFWKNFDTPRRGRNIFQERERILCELETYETKMKDVRNTPSFTGSITEVGWLLAENFCLSLETCIVIFRRKFSRGKYSTQWSAFFLCPENAHDAQTSLHSRQYIDYWKCVDFTAVRKQKVADSNPAIGHFLHVFRYSLITSYFLNKN